MNPSQFAIICGVVAVLILVFIIRDLSRIKELLKQLEQADILSQQEEASATSEVPLRLNQDNWAAFEAKVHNLKRVIVVADMVQQPHDSLRDAVIHNFSRGVHYAFIVSQSKAGSELHGYLDVFKALATIAIKKHNLKTDVEKLVSIESLPDDWNSIPLVFYRVEDTDAPISARSRFKTLAFWGDKVNAGIADHYESLPPPVADALAIAIMSGAPKPVKEALHNLEQDDFLKPEKLLPPGVEGIKFYRN